MTTNAEARSLSDAPALAPAAPPDQQVPARLPLSLWRLFWDFAVERLKLEIKRVLQASRLHAVTVREAALAKAQFVLITTLRNETLRLPYFLEYYRKLGIEHFIIVDNESDDDVQDLVRPMTDVSIWSAKGSFKKARYGVVWMNHLLSKYCAGKWILNVDVDEFLVFLDQDEQGLPALARRLEGQGVRGLATFMLDMYSDRPVAENLYRPGQDPLEVCPFFDAYGYVETVESPLSVKFVRGGPRSRVFVSRPQDSPWLQKTVFIKWKRHFAFIQGSATLVWPPNLADPAYADQRGMPSALLHFKFLSEFFEKVAEEQARQQHCPDYGHYQATIDEGKPLSFMFEGSRRYRDWTSLEEVGLLSRPVKAKRA
ncbi:MAG: glycosyltransferase family 2 protein [Hyphomonadaceae bacterium]